MRIARSSTVAHTENLDSYPYVSIVPEGAVVADLTYSSQRQLDKVANLDYYWRLIHWLFIVRSIRFGHHATSSLSSIFAPGIWVTACRLLEPGGYELLVPWRCTCGAVARYYTHFDVPDRGGGVSMATVHCWTGREAKLLRQALRLSVRRRASPVRCHCAS